MDYRQNSYLSRIEKFICDEQEDIDILDNQINTFFEEGFKLLYENVLPVLAIALIINIIIMFTLSVEIAMSQWFWLRDPLSVILAFILVKTISYLRNSVQVDN